MRVDPALTLFDQCRMVFDTAIASPIPQSKPADTQRQVLPNIVTVTSSRRAPNARRRAISLVRCETKQTVTLYIPAALMASARSAKTPTSNALNRGSAAVFDKNSSMVKTLNTDCSLNDERIAPFTRFNNSALVSDDLTMMYGTFGP